MHSDPFNCCILPNFVEDDSYLEGLKSELLELLYQQKDNDLYGFQQVSVGIALNCIGHYGNCVNIRSDADLYSVVSQWQTISSFICYQCLFSGVEND